MKVRFANRSEAGRELAKKLRHFAFHPDAVVLALPRGGVPVAYEIAVALHLPLEVFVVRKLGVPGHEEYAMGAIASGGAYYINQAAVDQLRISPEEIHFVVDREKKEIERREQEYGAGVHSLLTNKTLIVVDDGLATGSTMHAAVKALRQQNPREIIIAVPVAPPEAVDQLLREVEQVVALLTPEFFYAVGEWYEDFDQTTDEEVRTLVQNAERVRQNAPAGPVIF